MHRLYLIVLLGTGLLVGCRGMLSEEPPIHLNQNMDFQNRFEAQEPNLFFADGRAMRTPPPGTVARGLLRDDTEFYFGRTSEGGYVEEIPVQLTEAFLARGAERYDIYCAVCHGISGDGRGIIMTGNGGQGYGYVPPPSYHDERLRQVEDGYLYTVIAEGVRTMPPYGHQVSVADRWAIVAYIRALQRSQYAQPGDVPPGTLPELQQGGAD